MLILPLRFLITSLNNERSDCQIKGAHMTRYRTTRAGFILATADVPALSKFYQEALGFELEQEFSDPPFVILTQAGMRLSLTQHGHIPEDMPTVTFSAAHAPSSPASCMVLEVDDCDAARAELEQHGVTFRSDTFRPPWGGARFYCEDPAGNLIEIEELS